MGRETTCTARFGGRTSDGRLFLETDELVFRGDRRLTIPLDEVTSASVEDGWLEVVHGSERASFRLGPQAQAWADRLRGGKPLLDKLGVKEGMRVSILHLSNAGFVAELRARGADVTIGRRRSSADLVFMGAEHRRDLARLALMESAIARDGAVWVVYPKGRQEIREVEVIESGVAAGLVDTKVVRFSESHTALKFVIPKARR